MPIYKGKGDKYECINSRGISLLSRVSKLDGRLLNKRIRAGTVPDLVRVSVVAPIGNSDHSSSSAVISMAQDVLNLCVSWKVFLKHQVNWNTVCGAMKDLPLGNIWSNGNPVDVLNEHLLLLVGRFVPTKVISVRNKDKPWFDDQCRHAFGLNQEAHLRWTRDRAQVNWEEFVRCQVRANETYSEAKRQFNARNIDVLMNGGPILSLFCSA